MIDEKTLIANVKEGSYDSFSSLYNLWVDRLYQFVYSFTKSYELSEDIVQETFVKVWLNRKNLQTQYSFRSYLFTISYHLFIKEFKRQLNNPSIEEYMEYCRNKSSDDDIIDKEIDFQTFMDNLKKAKDKLTPRQKEIFELNKEYNLSISEIASKLSLQEQTVRNQLTSSLKIIRKEVGNCLELFVFFI
jgi:RNA polymerase sigma factor (sigma-70 family)